MFSVVLVVKNEADNIVRTLRALEGVSDDIVVVDTGSTDDTIEFARAEGARVYQEPWRGYIDTKNAANRHARHDWILSLDADEVVSPELAETLRNLNLEPKTVYELDLITNFAGQWVRHSGWYPDWKRRLFPKELEWRGELVHEYIHIPDDYRIVRLVGKVYHYSYQTDADHLARMENYAQLTAEKLFRQGKRPNIFKQIFGPPARFVRTYIVKRGFLDGKLGLKLAWRNAVLVNRKYELLRWKWYGKQS